ncbi:MAG TPA: hypothetical protein VGB03_07970 [Acidimicrobiales bacterium]
MDAAARERAGFIALAVVVAVLVGLVGVRAYALFTDRGARELRVEAGRGELTVDQVFEHRPRQAMVVRGYVTAGGGFPARLCTALRESDPPQCVGPYLVLHNLDASRVPVHAKGDGDDRVVWSPEPVALLGTVTTDRMTVTEILR